MEKKNENAILEDLEIKDPQKFEKKEVVKKEPIKKEKKAESKDEAYLNHPKFAKYKQGAKKNDK